ncbi:MAG: hypothetical protein DI637_03870 [Citromicrobium sp.]|nr:MAG: hypothetical protein DI637_03870 [Citromicrobium sp.]
MKDRVSRAELRRRVQQLRQERGYAEPIRKASDEPVPGPTENAATNLFMADLTMRAASYITLAAVEKSMLKGRYGKDQAREILGNRSLGQTFMAFGLAKLATRSVPGAVIVGGGALAKTLYDRRKSRRRQRLKGDRKLVEPTLDD